MKRIIIGRDNIGINGYMTASLWAYGDLSQNSSFYKIRNELFDVEIFIFKGSKEADKLEKWIENKENLNNEAVESKALEYILPRITSKDIQRMVEEQKELAFEQGRRANQLEIQKALGID